MFKKTLSLFRVDMDPACGICENSSPSDEGGLHCQKCRRSVTDYEHCKKFLYAPLKRVPRSTPPLPQYSKEDFML